MTASPSLQLDAITSLLTDAQALMRENRLKDAAKVLHKVFALDPANALALHAMAEISLQRGHLDTAWKLAYQAVQQNPALNHVIQLARIARAMGNLDEALHWYEAVLRSFPDNIAALTHIAQIYDEAGYRTRAKEYCEKAQALMPENFLFLRGIAKLYPFTEIERVYQLYQRAQPPANMPFEQRLIFESQFIVVKEAVERAKRGLSAHAESSDDLFFRFAPSEVDALEAMADTALAEKPSLLIALACKAACIMARGNAKESEKLFHACAELDPKALYQNVMFNETFYQQLEATSDDSLSADLPPLVDVLTPAFINAPIIFLSCDTKYFHKFARPLLLSLNEVAPGAQAHVHIMNATGESLNDAKLFCESLANLRIAMSSEDMTSRATDLLSARNYFHAIRFTRMLQYLKRYQKPLWLLDVDGLMNRDPRPMFESFRGGDVTLYGHAGRLEPWVQFNASTVGVQPSVAGIRFLKLVSAYINYFFVRDKLSWGIDQLAMYGVFNFLREIGEPLNLRMLPDNVLDGEYKPEGIIWTNGTSAKFTNSKTLADPSLGLPDSPRIRYFKALDKYTAQLK